MAVQSSALYIWLEHMWWKLDMFEIHGKRDLRPEFVLVLELMLVDVA